MPAPSDRPALTRRAFLRGAALGAGAVLAGCGAAARRPTTSPAPAPDAAASEFSPGTTTRLPLLAARGTDYEIGRAAGQRFAAEIRAGIADRAAWLRDLRAFADSLPRSVEATFVAAAQRHTPAAWDDLRGLADGSGVPLRDLLLVNLNPELGAMRDAQARPSCALEPTPGCSTVVLNHGGRTLVCHNEDGNQAYLGRMFMLRGSPTGRPSYLGASYPGVLPGNAPWANERGVLMTTNFISTREVKVGVPRYFLDREAMTARTLDEALRLCRHPDRAYAFHHVLAAKAPRRVVSLESTPSRDSLVAIAGLFLHTNHLVHPALAAVPQDPQYVGTSSFSRWQVLTAWKAAHPDPSAVTVDAIMDVLASHQRRPYSPCRHPQGEITGATLLTAVFDLGAPDLRLWREQPCLGRAASYSLPAPPPGDDGR